MRLYELYEQPDTNAVIARWEGMRQRSLPLDHADRANVRKGGRGYSFDDLITSAISKVGEHARTWCEPLMTEEVQLVTDEGAELLDNALGTYARFRALGTDLWMVTQRLEDYMDYRYAGAIVLYAQECGVIRVSEDQEEVSDVEVL